jgi:2-iminobutanoate/2-iminopropanoate deaminase
MRLFICCLTTALIATSCERGHSKEVIFTDKVAAPMGPYSQAIRSGGTLFVSGQIALRADGSLDTSSIANECRQTLTNISLILEEAGMKLNSVTKATLYLTDISNFKKVNEVYAEFFEDAPPARETVEVRNLPKGAHLEISVIAR